MVPVTLQNLGTVRMLTCVLVFLAVTPKSASGQSHDSQASDSVTLAPRAVTPFYLVPGWGATVAQTEHTSAQEPLCYSIERLCRLHSTHFDAQSCLREDRSPLAWPEVFARDLPNATRQRAEARALMDACGLVYRELIPLDLTARAMAESLAAAISVDLPVLLNAPQSPVVYGYDRREPDHWWWYDLAGIPEIVLESERALRFTMWSDDPAAGIAWIVTGVGDFHASDPDSLRWAYLRRVNNSVQGVPDEGVEPYPLSLRRFRDLLASPDSIPISEAAHNTSDPLGISRAKASRENIVEVLQLIGGQQVDSAQSGPLRLAEYHMHGSVAALSELAELLYGDSGSGGGMARSINSGNLQVQTRALQLVTELLKSEKLAMESLGLALDAHDRATPKPAAPRPKRRGR